LAREDAISVWRRLMGPTKVFQCQLSNPDSIRAKHGLTDTRNATHGSGNFVLFAILINGVIFINTHILLHCYTFSKEVILIYIGILLILNYI